MASPSPVNRPVTRAPSKSSNESLTDIEIDARREAGLKKLLATPHKPHKAATDAKHAKKPRSDQPS
jgi:hypothetical protein